METMARCCELGVGVEPDEKHAAYWRKKAVAEKEKEIAAT